VNRTKGRCQQERKKHVQRVSCPERTTSSPGQVPQVTIRVFSYEVSACASKKVSTRNGLIERRSPGTNEGEIESPHNTQSKLDTGKEYSGGN